jgi:hypothetical protein
MKLDQKQMHVVSQLFMAAGKAGHAFDLGRFTRDSTYASETLAKLSMAATAAPNDSLNALVLLTMDVMASAAAVAVMPASAPAVRLIQESARSVETQYVGRLR